MLHDIRLFAAGLLRVESMPLHNAHRITPVVRS
jgi:hypothetical protein